MHLLELKDLSKYYHTGEVITLGLRKVNMSFDIGEFVAVVGESGSGKSTLMNVISGMDTFEEGEMYYKGEETLLYRGKGIERTISRLSSRLQLIDIIRCFRTSTRAFREFSR